MSKLLKDLNPYQREAVEHFEGPLLILAGAGSGKTRVITYRIAYLIKERQIHPSNILGLTFTNKAAGEMQARVERLIGAKSAPWIKTFHSTCARILREHIAKLSPSYNDNFTILDEDDQREAIAEAMQQLDIPTEQFSPQMIATLIDRAKDDLISPEEFALQRSRIMDGFLLEIAARVYKRYQRMLERSNAVDFGDLIRLTVQLFWDRLKILNLYRDRFRFILIDEYQDTNYAQYIFSRLLAEKYENICVVGDDDQAIFGWRGADPTNILRFEEDFPQAKVVELKRNYRSTKRILRVASAIIQHNYTRKPKELHTLRQEGERITLYSAANERDEAEYIASEIRRLWKTEGVKLNDIAVLYRVNTLSRVLEEALIRWQIPYEVVRGLRFYERMEIKDILAYLRFILNQADELSLLRILNRPRRGLGKKTVAAIQSYARHKGLSLWEGLRKLTEEESLLNGGQVRRLREFIELIADCKERAKELTVSELTEHLLERTGYLQDLAGNELEAEERLGNIKELLSQMCQFAQTKSGSSSIREFLEEIALFSEADGYSGEEGRVALMTLHSAKGLEFSHVFIAGLEENLLPHSRSIKEGQLEEERRLCYVGLTRAKERLYLSYAVQRSLYGTILLNKPSRFIGEMPPEDLVFDLAKEIYFRYNSKFSG